MIFRNLNEHDAHSVGVRDPHLHQPPRLPLRLADHRYPRPHQPIVLEPHVADLNPDRQGTSVRISRASTDLEETISQEKDQPRRFTSPELSIAKPNMSR